MQDPNPRIEDMTDMSQDITAKIVIKRQCLNPRIQDMTQMSPDITWKH